MGNVWARAMAHYFVNQHDPLFRAGNRLRSELSWIRDEAEYGGRPERARELLARIDAALDTLRKDSEGG